MAATVKTRIQLKYDTEQNWNKATHFVPLRGELIIYSTDNAHPFCRIKVGDGTTPIVDLPFLPWNEDGDGNSDYGITTHTTAYWSSQTSYIPPAGELVIYSDYKQITKNGQNYNEPAIKVGDGTTYVVDLPFVHELNDALLTNHINNTIVHITDNERTFWNHKVNCEDIIEEETLILNRS